MTITFERNHHLFLGPPARALHKSSREFRSASACLPCALHPPKCAARPAVVSDLYRKLLSKDPKPHQHWTFADAYNNMGRAYHMKKEMPWPVPSMH